MPVNGTASPSWNSAPFVGAVIDTVGAALIVIETDWVAALPPLSVTDAVIVSAPLVSELVIDAPAPSAPSLLELHWMFDDRTPSSRSVALPVNGMASPGENVAPVSGDVMPMRGGALTTTVIFAVSVAPALSVTAAVIVCVPLDSPLVVSEAPLPRAPSMLELHWMPAARFPSSGSVADAVKVTGRSGANVVPSGGAVMLTTGRAFTVIVLLVVLLPPAPLTVSATVYVPPAS